jgi:actin-related protein 5
MHEKRQTILDKLKERKKKFEIFSNRKSFISQARMKTMASMMGEDNLTKSGRARKRKNAGPPGGDEEEDDGFGENDGDWMVYHDIKDNEEAEEEEDQQKLEHYENLLLQYDENFMREEDRELEKRKTSPVYRLLYGPKGYLDLEDLKSQHQLRLNVERIRIPEILFQPHMIGVDQAGVMEVLTTVIQQFDTKTQEKMVQVFPKLNFYCARICPSN